MTDILLLCFEFFKTGLFAVGGGLATLPFLTKMTETHPDWFTLTELTNMVAVSESTPGPIGVNMASYVGYTVVSKQFGPAFGIFGSILTTLSLTLPSIIIILIIARMLDKYMTNRGVQKVFSGIRPAVAGLIAAAGWSVFRITLFRDVPFSLDFFNLPAISIFAVIFVLTQIKPTKKIHPVAFIAAGAVLGLVLPLS